LQSKDEKRAFVSVEMESISMASNTPQYVCRNCGFSLPNPGATCARCGVNNSAYGNYNNNTQYGNNPYQYPNQYENQANLGAYVVPPPPQVNIPVPPPPRKRSSLPIIAAVIGAIILIIAGGSIFAISANNNAIHAKATEQAVSAQNTSTAQVKQATAQAATATAQASLDPYAPKGTNETLALTDSLTKPDKWKANLNNPKESCTFSDGLHMKVTEANTLFYCESQVSGASYNNLSFEVEMTVLSGDCGGMILRDSGTSYYKGYVFSICGDSSYFLYREDYDPKTKQSTATTIDNGTTVGFQSNQVNKIAMMATGNIIEGYLNGKKLSSKQDNAFLDKGLVGLVAIDNGQSTEVKFNNAKVWSFSS
jgi:ribosomal protein L40E